MSAWLRQLWLRVRWPFMTFDQRAASWRKHAFRVEDIVRTEATGELVVITRIDRTTISGNQIF